MWDFSEKPDRFCMKVFESFQVMCEDFSPKECSCILCKTTKTRGFRKKEISNTRIKFWVAHILQLNHCTVNGKEKCCYYLPGFFFSILLCFSNCLLKGSLTIQYSFFLLNSVVWNEILKRKTQTNKAALWIMLLRVGFSGNYFLKTVIRLKPKLKLSFFILILQNSKKATCASADFYACVELLVPWDYLW